MIWLESKGQLGRINMFSDVIYQHYHGSPFSMQIFIQVFGSFGLIQANIFRWYFVSTQDDFQYFLINSNDRRNWWLHSGKFVSTFPKLWGTLRPWAPAGLCILPAHPASVSARASHSQALCVLAPMILLPWWKTERKNNRILSRSALRANCDKMLFSPRFGDSCWLLLVLGDPENVKIFLKFF